MITENIKNIGTLKIPKNVELIFDALHSRIKNTEWSGILFYDLTKGDIKELKNLEFTARFFYLMDIGTSGYTEYDYNKNPELNLALIKSYDLYPDGLEKSWGHCHSHHSMSTFFSGTDISELESNYKAFNYYLSLIVNFSKEYSAKIAIATKVKSKNEYSFRDTTGKFITSFNEITQDVMLVGDLKVELESNSILIPDWIDTRIVEINKAKTAISYTREDDFEFSLFKNNPISSQPNFSKSITSVKIDPIEEFVHHLITLGNKNTTIRGKLIELKSTTTNGYELFLENLSENLEILHSNYYKSDDRIEIHLLEVYKWLLENKTIYKDYDFIFSDLIDICSAYV